MKTLIILVLAFALAAGAFLSKPSPTSFQNFIQASQPSGISFSGIFHKIQTDEYLKSVNYHDRLLWMTVEKDGQVQYIGAFNHWFNRVPATS